MKIVLLTPGTGSYHCGVCMRDNALAKELIRTGHDAVMLPMYLPLTLDESAASTQEPEIFYGGINVYLQQKFALFRNTPRWLDRCWMRAGCCAGWRNSGMTGGAEVGELTHSMLLGEQGNQAKELDRADRVAARQSAGCRLAFHRAAGGAGAAHPAGARRAGALFAARRRQLSRYAGRAVADALLGSAGGARADVSTFVAPSRYFAELMAKRMRLRGGTARRSCRMG